MWKDFFYFSRRERQGILLLIVLIAGVFIGKFLFTTKVSAPTEIELEWSKNNEKQEFIVDKAKDPTVQKPYQPANQNRQYVSSKSKQPAEKRNYYPPPTETRVVPKQNQYPVTEKYAAGTVIELNKSDTLQLMKIPGIGSSFAKRITSYRNLLGGFYRLEQLQEIYGMYEELYEKITPFLEADADEITPIQVNTASLDKLRSHPYINFYQAKAIIEIRKKKGKIESIQEFFLLEEFTEEVFERIKPYLGF
jgi:DNA uptake protein ComE-like DNA-binding protein